VHRTAAWRIISSLYTPKLIASNPIERCALKWYTYFDTFVGMLAGEHPLMSREWLEALSDAYRFEHERDPENITTTYEHCITITRLISWDTFKFFTEASAGNLSNTEMDETASNIISRYDDWEMTFPMRLANPEHIVSDFPGHPYDPNDPDDPLKPCPIFQGPNFPTNIFRLAILSARSLFESRVATIKGLQRPEKANKKLVTEIFGIVNALRFWKGCPKGAFLALRPIFSFANFIAPLGWMSERQINWARETFAAYEEAGYVDFSFPLLKNN